MYWVTPQHFISDLHLCIVSFLLIASMSLSNSFFFYPCRYMSTLYSHSEFPNKGPKDINKELMNRVSSNPLRLLLPQHITNYIQALWSKKASGQPVTFTDIFGMLIGETLIPAVRAVRELMFALISMEFLISLSVFCSPVYQSASSSLCFISSHFF